MNTTNTTTNTKPINNTNTPKSTNNNNNNNKQTTPQKPAMQKINSSVLPIETTTQFVNELNLKPKQTQQQQKLNASKNEQEVGVGDSSDQTEEMNSDNTEPDTNEKVVTTPKPTKKKLFIQDINFGTLFEETGAIGCTKPQAAKIRCVLNYFRRMAENLLSNKKKETTTTTTNMNTNNNNTPNTKGKGNNNNKQQQQQPPFALNSPYQTVNLNVSFFRRYLPKMECPDWSKSTKTFAGLTVDDEGVCVCV